MDKFSVWIDSAMVYMKRGIEKDAVLPKALTEKLIPQFAEMVNAKYRRQFILFFYKINACKFSDEVKKDLTAKYTATINEN
jgi:uncharacterized protein (DUF885 family)